MDWIWIAFPLIGAAIGYATNYIAVRMLFRPRRPVWLVLFRFQGLIPRRRHQIAERVADIVSEELVRPEKLHEALEGPQIAESVREQVEPRVTRFMEQQLGKLPPMIRALVPPELTDGMRQAILKEIVDALPEIAENVARNAKDQLDVRAMVLERMDQFDLNELEQIVLRIARKELHAIEILGGVLGALVGLAQAAVTWLWLT